jgi:hypothetical protein
MSSRIDLRWNTQSVEIPESGLRVCAPGLDGSITWHGARGASDLRAETGETAVLTEALAEAELEDLHTLDVEAATPSRPPGYERLLASDVAPDEIEIEAPALPGETEFAIYVDEDGVTTLHFPSPPAAGETATGRGSVAGVNTYRIPLRQASGAAGGPSQSRFLGGLARKIIKIVARAAFKPLAGPAAFAAAQRWENRCRAEQGFHGGTVDQLLNQPALPFANWGAVEGKKALLFVHGTTSSTAGAFQGLKDFPDVAQELYRRYQGRVLGINHHTLTKSVAQNAADLYAALPPGEYTFDIISHSRGGLVARALLELDAAALSGLLGKPWSAPSGVRLKIGNMVFVGTPNAATDLADPKDVPVVLNRLAAIIGFLKDAPPVLALGAVLSIASGVAQAILEGVSDVGEAGLRSLPGLADMAPGCKFLGALGNAAPDRYWSVQAQYRADGGLVAALENEGIDIVFRDKANDLVVPTEGVSETTAFRLRGLTPSHVWAFKPQDGVHHLNYFRQRVTWDAILGWLR